MPSLLKKKPVVKPAPKEQTNETQKATGPLLKTPDERPVPKSNSPRQTEDQFLAFTIQRKHDKVTFLYELVVVRMEKQPNGLFQKTEVRRDTGTMREIVESKIFRDLSEIVF